MKAASDFSYKYTRYHVNTFNIFRFQKIVEIKSLKMQLALSNLIGPQICKTLVYVTHCALLYYLLYLYSSVQYSANPGVLVINYILK